MLVLMNSTGGTGRQAGVPMGVYVYNDAYVVSQSRWIAWLGVLRCDRQFNRLELLAMWWICAATEGRVAPQKVARRLDAYVAKGANRAKVWEGVTRIRRPLADIERANVAWCARNR